jgi:type II secretory ATPase GspE/PulE/Tfp pilus assembly ATPase PilB-like protein
MRKQSPFNARTQKDEISEAPQVEELLKNLEFHKSLQNITRRINNSESLEEVLIDIKEDIRRLFNIYILNVYILERSKKEIFSLRMAEQAIEEIHLPANNATVAGFVAQRKKILHIADPYNERELKKVHEQLTFDRSFDQQHNVVTGQIIAIPILYDSLTIGVLEIMNKKGGEKIDDYRQIFLDEITTALGNAFYNREKFFKPKQSRDPRFDDLIEQNLLSTEDMDKAWQDARTRKEPYEKILRTLYNISAADIGQALAKYYSCQYIAYSEETSAPFTLLQNLERKSLEHLLWIPLSLEDGKIHVLVDDPTDILKKEKIESLLKTNSILYDVSLSDDILKYIDRFYTAVANQKPSDESTEDQDRPSMSMPRMKSTREEKPVADDLPIKTDTPEREEQSNNDLSSRPDEEDIPVVPVKLSSRTARSRRLIEPQPILVKSPEETITSPEPEKIIVQRSDEPAKFENIQTEAEPIVSHLDNKAVQIVGQMINEAYLRRASDIHIEPHTDTKTLEIRFRMEGECIPYQSLPFNDHELIIRQLKQIANLNPSLKGMPQTGRFRFRRLTEDEIEMNIVILPTQGGVEDATLRILNKGKVIPLEVIGFSSFQYSQIIKVLGKRHGLIIVSGPAAEGKTTTLHAFLKHMNTPGRKIWTAEDPVEIVQPGLRQLQLQPQKGFGFPQALRSFLSADPDIISVGQMYEPETTRACLQAALSGSLVLTTMLADSAMGSIVRLLDMGIPPLILSDALLAVIGQRLIRILCPKCKEQYHPGQEEYDELTLAYGKEAFAELNNPYNDDFKLYRPRGCDDCSHTGYSGHIGIHELLIFSPVIKRMIRLNKDISSIYQTAISEGMNTLLQNGLKKALQGHTDTLQIRRVCLT